MWSAYLVDTIDGRIAAPIDLPSFTWTMSVTDSAMSTTRDKSVGEGETSGLRVPWSAIPGDTASARANAVCQDKRSICLFWRTGHDRENIGTPILMGAITPRTDTVEDTSFSLSSPMQILADRLMVAEGGYGTGAGATSPDEITLSGLTMRGIASEAGWRLTLAKPGGELPIDWTYRGERGTNSRSWKAFDIQNNSGSAILDELAKAGPDMQFRPYLTQDGMHVRWQFLAGSDSIPTLGQTTIHRFSWHPYGGTIEDLTIDHIGPVMRVYATGSGTDAATITHLSEDLRLVQTRDPWPLRETTWSDTDADRPDTLVRHADATLQANNTPLMQISGTIHADDADANGVPLHPLGTIWPGELVELAVDGFPTLPDGTYQCQIMQMDGDETDQVRLTFDAMSDPIQ